MFLSIDGTFWIQLINFVIFFAILKVVFLRPVGEAIRKRRAYIDSVQNDYERYAHEAKAIRTQAEAKRTEARVAAAEYFASSRAEANAQAATVMAEHTGIATNLIRQAHATIAEELEVAQARKAALAQTLSQTLLQRALGVFSK